MEKRNHKNYSLIAFCASLSFLFVIICGFLVFLSVKFDRADEAFRYVSRYVTTDLIEVMSFSLSSNPYLVDFSTMYMPFGILLMMPFTLICRTTPNYHELYTIPDGSLSDWYEKKCQFNANIVATWQFWVSAVMFLTFFITVIGILLFHLRKWQSKRNFVLTYIAIILSGPFAYGILRGTNVFQCMTFVLIFLLLYKSPKKWQREIALVCLAIAGVLKIYPLIFGVLLLKNKRFFESIRVAFYFLLFALLPFFIYSQPFVTLKAYLMNLSDFTTSTERLSSISNLSVFNLVNCIFKLFGMQDTSISRAVGITFLVITFGISLFIAFVSKNKVSTIWALCSGMFLVPQISYFYVLMFMSIPLCAIIDEWQEMSKSRRIVYFVFYCYLAFLPIAMLSAFIINTIMTIIVLIMELSLSIKTVAKKPLIQKLNRTGELK